MFMYVELLVCSMDLLCITNNNRAVASPTGGVCIYVCMYVCTCIFCIVTFIRLGANWLRFSNLFVVS